MLYIFMFMKAKGQRSPRKVNAGPFVGLTEGSRLRILSTQGRGFNPPEGPPHLILPSSGSSRSWGTSSGMSQGQGLETRCSSWLRWPEEGKAKMTCHNCQTECKRFGQTPQGNQRFRCHTCSKTFSDSQPRPLGEMHLSLDRALLCIQLIVEGNSIRSTERITGVHRDTILALLIKAGERSEKLLADMITRVFGCKTWSATKCGVMSE
jgi:transposase-like protein